MAKDAVNVAQLLEFDEIVDVRSPGEFALDHIPGAINCPVLDNDERARVGTIHAQQSAFAAKQIGATLVARNIAHHVETAFAAKPRSWRPLVYCWRGGQRSAAMTIVLRQIGWDARQLEGGYKAYRRQVVTDIDQVVGHLRFVVVCGLTGSGKSALLNELAICGSQVLDLEQLAEHRGSVLGTMPGSPQPCQKKFESRLWNVLRDFDTDRPIFVEAESKRIGSLRVPETLITAIRSSPCVALETVMPARVNLLLREYEHFVTDKEELYARLDCLVPLHGNQRIKNWKTLAGDGQWHAFVGELLQQHYDPAYRKSTISNYSRLAQALRLTVNYGTCDELNDLAKQLAAQPYSVFDSAACSDAAAA